MVDVAYVRVSSVDQNLERQLADVNLVFAEIFKDKISAKDRNRPQLNALIHWVRKGDKVHIHSIDRLARNLKDLQDIVEELNRKGVHIHFHKEGLSFTGGENPIQKLMFQMLGAFAEFETSLIRERQREGIAAAKAAGKHIGRKHVVSGEQRLLIKKDAAAGMSVVKIAKKYAIARTTIYGYIK